MGKKDLKENAFFCGAEEIDALPKGIFIRDGIKYCVLPGFCDVHVHFREPGFSYKETIKTGTAAAARGGYTSVCTMPNLKPVPDTLDHLEKQRSIIEKDACIPVFPYASITIDELGEQLSDMERLAPYVIAFSDDGRGVQSEELMYRAMEKAHSLNKMIVAHCEVNELLNGGYIHEGEYAKKHGHRGICSESEWKQIERDIRLADKTGCAYHVCHISCKESVELIRDAKASGVNISCETGPHYLLMTDKDIREEGRFKMNPPLRSEDDREALLQGIDDGTIDMIITDHAPHSAEEKGRGLEKSAFGVVGLETAFPVLYTYLVKNNIISFEKLINLMSDNPRKRFSISSPQGKCLWNLSDEYEIDSNAFLSMGKATPFLGWKVFGKCVLNTIDQKTVYRA